MCGSRPVSSLREALASLDDALGYLARFDAASAPVAEQADAVRALERAEARHTAARARMLAAFSAQGGPEADGQGSVRTWLRWQTRVTTGAAAGSVAWARRLAAHPRIAGALAAGDVSASWAKEICAWSDQLPADKREDADAILAEAALGGVDLPELAGLAREMLERSGQDLGGGGRGAESEFDDRWFRLGITFRGAGRAEGDLTPGCAAALEAVLEALSKKAGPEDVRTAAQRRHDALGEACRRLIAAGLLPDAAGQPSRIYLHMTLDQLRRIPGAAGVEAAWAAARARDPGWLAGPEADATACDGSVIPIVTGHVDWAALDELTDAFLALRGRHGDVADGTATRGRAPRSSPAPRPASCPGCGCACGGCTCLPPRQPSPQTRERLRRALLGLAVEALSGPGGLGAALRAKLGGFPLVSVSLPLDVGASTDTIPVHLRRAVAARHGFCAFPGCEQPARVCQVHHLIPRSEGGPTAIGNLVPLCSFHHLVAVHHWGWKLTLHTDGSTTAISPVGRLLSSHGPPARGS